MSKRFFAITTAAAMALVLAVGGYYFFSRPAGQHKLISNPFNQATHSATGFGTDAARVDSQITLKIPDGQGPAVYDYLRQTYVDSDAKLKSTFPDKKLSGEKRVDISVFTDGYFDTPNLDLYVNNNSARHRSRTNTTDPADRKNGRELVQVQVTAPGQFERRTELKFDTQTPRPSAKLRDDFHPLIGLVTKVQQADFKKAFSDLGLDPYKLRYILTNTQKRSRVYLDLDGTNILSFSVDEGSSRMLWAKAHITSVDVGLVENVYTDANSADRQKLAEIRAFVLKDLMDQFPELTVNLEEKYGLLLDQLIPQVPFFVILLRFGII